MQPTTSFFGWMSHKSKRPLESVVAAEILVASEAFNEVRIIAHAYQQLLSVQINIQVCVDSWDIFTSLSTPKNSVDRSIRRIFASLSYAFQVGIVDFIEMFPG